jgi:hypothetical protein
MDYRRPARFPWNYDRGEIIADGVIHAIGVCFGLIGAVIIIVIASHSTKIVAIASVLIYAAGLLSMSRMERRNAREAPRTFDTGEADFRRPQSANLGHRLPYR